MPGKRQKKIFFLPKINFKNIPFINFFYGALILNAINLVYVLIIQKNLQPELPLFYGLPEGQDQLTNSLSLSIPALVSFAISFINFFIALYSKREFFQQALILASFAVSIFSIITVVKISLLIGSF